jgi:phosphate transport system substrate-binding protein
MNRNWLLAITLLALTLISYLQPAPTAAPVADLSPIARDYPRVDGSTSTHPLQTLIACRILEVDCQWTDEWLFDRTRRYLPEFCLCDPSEPAVAILNIQHSGTHGSYVNLIAGRTDLILVARPPSQDELQLARQEHVILDVRPVALDAFVFLVNGANPVQNLPLEDVRAIYTGAVTRWSQLDDGGGATVDGTDGTDGTDGDDAIHPYLRNRNSGSQELMERLVMRGTPMIDAPDMILPSMIGPINAIGEDPLGIGYSVYYYATFMLPDERVKLLGIDGRAPTFDNLATRRYPLTTEVYVAVRAGTPRTHTAVRLRDWLLTAEGQATVQQSGYVPLDR